MLIFSEPDHLQALESFASSSGRLSAKHTVDWWVGEGDQTHTFVSPERLYTDSPVAVITQVEYGSEHHTRRVVALQGLFTEQEQTLHFMSPALKTDIIKYDRTKRHPCEVKAVVKTASLPGDQSVDLNSS